MEDGRYGRRIRAFRKLKRVQQAELAKQLGIPTALLGKFERGTRTPSQEILEKIAQQLNIDINELIGEELSHLPSKKEEEISE